MAEYVTREDIVSVGAAALTDLYDDADPGEIQAPTGHIGQAIIASHAALDAEGSTLVGAIRLSGDAVSANPVFTFGAFGAGASGTGAGQTVSQVATVIPLDINVTQGAQLRMNGLVAGTAGDDINISCTLRFDNVGGNALYLTREDTLAIGAQQLTDEYDDASPPVFIVPQNVSRVARIIAAADVQDAAADDVAVAALQFRGGAVAGSPTISVAAGGTGNTGTPVGSDTATAPLILDVDIPLARGLPLQLWGLLAGVAGTIGNMSATAVLV